MQAKLYEFNFLFQSVYFICFCSNIQVFMHIRDVCTFLGKLLQQKFTFTILCENMKPLTLC